MHIFIPVGESLIEQLNLSPEDLVPFKLEYEVLRPGELFTEICEVPQEDMAES